MLLLNFTCSSPVKAQSKDVTLSEKIIWALNSFKGFISVVLILFSRFIRIPASGKLITDGNGFKFIADNTIYNFRCDIGIFIEYRVQIDIIF